MFKKYNEHDYIARVALICNALYLGITGGFLLTLSSIEYSAITYDLMSHVVSLDVFGILFIVSGVFLVHAALQVGKKRSLSLLVGGLLGGLLLGVYAMASFEGSLNGMMPLRYAVVACFDLIISIVGGMGLWIAKSRT